MLDFAIRALALYRLAHALTREDGPGFAFFKARTWLQDQEALPDSVRSETGCPLCLSFWLAFLLVPRRRPVPYVLYALALSGVTAALVTIADGPPYESDDQYEVHGDVVSDYLPPDIEEERP